MKKLKQNYATLGVFLFCGIVVVLTQIFLLEPILKFSIFSEDDWKWLLLFKTLPDPDILSKIITIWTKIGIHEGSYAIYMGILGTILGENYSIYQLVNISFKIFSILTLFPLILILFKNRLLAFLTTIFFAISSATTGSLYWYMKGGVFLGITLMNLFFITYYYTLLRSSKALLFCSSLLILSAYLASPTRIYPVFIIIFFIELFLILKHKSKVAIKQSMVRLICFLLPSIYIALQAPVSPNGTPTQVPLILLNQAMHGNFYNFLSPFAAMGYSLLTNGAWKYFGPIDHSTFFSFTNFLSFLFARSIWFFLFSSIFLALIISKKPVKFFVKVFTLNIVLDIIFFIVVNKYFALPAEYITTLDPSLFNLTKYPTFIAFFITSVALLTFREWLKEKNNILLISIFVGPLFALIFLFPMWINVGFLLDGYSSTQYYYQISAVGMSLFLSSILTILYSKVKSRYRSVLILLLIGGIFFKFYRASSIEINRDFLPIYPERVQVTDQQVMHNKFLDKLGKPDKENNLLVFIELPNEPFLSNYYKRSLLLDSNSFAYMINWRRNRKETGCIGNISSPAALKSSLIFKDGKWGFLLVGKCQGKEPPLDDLYDYKTFATLNYQTVPVFFSPDSLYAYIIRDGELIDIKNDLLSNLNIKNHEK